MAACNNPDNGHYTGLADAFSFSGPDDQHIALEGPSIVFRWYQDSVSDFRFRMHRQGFPCHGYWQWYGNWCWDATRISTAHVPAVLTLLSRHRFEPSEGSLEMWDFYEGLNIE